jgi:NAD+ synthetase
MPEICAPTTWWSELSVEAEAYQALVLGVRDYIGKSGFKGAIIGFSGGIDSALTLCVAVDALGAEKVRAVMMPSPYTAQMSLDDSRAMIKTLGVRYDEIPISPAMQLPDDARPAVCRAAGRHHGREHSGRIRGNLLMALSNKTGSLVLTTGNKSEMAVGYCTLYGDMAGGFAVIKDVYKTLVYRLSRYRNSISPVIPENIIVRPPSAELKPDQTDQDSLPPYEVLDAIVRAYMEEDRSPREIIAAGLPERRSGASSVCCALPSTSAGSRRSASASRRVVLARIGVILLPIVIKTNFKKLNQEDART